MQRLVTFQCARAAASLLCCCKCFVVALAASHVFLVYCVVSIGVDTDTFEARWVYSFLHEQNSLMTPPDNTTLFGVQSIWIGMTLKLITNTKARQW